MRVHNVWAFLSGDRVSGPSDRTNRVLLAVVLGIFSLLPVLVCTHLPFYDYPNHLGRLEIYRKLAHDAYLSRFYIFKWLAIPNLAIDILVLPLERFMSVEQAARTIIVLAYANILASSIWLDKELHGKDYGIALFSGIFLYTGAFQFGFANYTIGISLALTAFAFWVRFREKNSALTFGISLILGILVYFAHLYAYGIYAICMAGYEASALWQECRTHRRLDLSHLKPTLRGALVTLLPLTLVLAGPSSANSGFRWSTLLWKFEGLTSLTVFAMPRVELPLLFAIAGTVIFALATGAMRFNARMTLAACVFALIFVLMPRTFFGSNYADYRLPGGAIFFVFAGLGWGKATQSGKRILTAILAMLLVVRVVSILVSWIPEQGLYSEYDRIFADVPPGSRVLVLEGTTGSTSGDRSPPLSHVPVFYAAKHDVFVPYNFTLPKGAELLQLAPAYAHLSEFAPYPEHARDMGLYDFVLTMRGPHFAIPPHVALKLIANGKTCALYKVMRLSN